MCCPIFHGRKKRTHLIQRHYVLGAILIFFYDFGFFLETQPQLMLTGPMAYNSGGSGYNASTGNSFNQPGMPQYQPPGYSM